MDISLDPIIAWGGGALRRVIATCAIAVVGLATLVSVPTSAGAWDQGSAEGTLWQLLNGARVNNGLAPLQQESTLWGLAQWRSRDMVERGYFSHEVAGTGCAVYCWYDSNGLSYVFGGENIGWNSGWTDEDSPVRVHEGFMNSPGHRANVLEPAYTHGGVGAYGRDGITEFSGMSIENIRVYTELFMQARAAPPPAPEPAPVALPPPPPPPPAAIPAPAPDATTETPEPAGTPEAADAKPDSDVGMAKAVQTVALSDLEHLLLAVDVADVLGEADADTGAGGSSPRDGSPAPGGMLRFT